MLSYAVFQRPGMNTDKLEEVEAEIHRRTAELAALKVHRNNLVPVNRLPPEILSAIFVQLRNTVSNFKQPDIWRPIRQVCHSWRVLADTTPTLWSRIYVRMGARVSRIAEMLDKSRRANLTVEVRVPTSGSKNFADGMQLVAQHTQRITSVRFWVPQWSSPPLAQQAFADLTKIGGVNADYSALRSLFVWGQYDQWAPRFDDVQHLLVPTMRQLYLGLKAIPDVAKVYAALRSMPALIILELHVTPGPRGTLEAQMPPVPEQKVALEHLQEIFLHGPPMMCAAILDSVAFPVTAKLSVRCPDSYTFGNDQEARYSPLLQSLLSKIDGNTGSEKRRHSSLYVRKSGMRACVIIDSWTQVRSVETLMSRPVGPDIHLVLPQTIATGFLRSLGKGLEDVRSFYLQDAQYSYTWASAIRKMVNLRDLVVAGDTCVALPEMLGADERWASMGKQQLRGLLRSHPVLPHLNSVTTLSPRFPSVGRWPPMPHPEFQGIDLILFRKVLTTRMNLSFGPATITIAARDFLSARKAMDGAGLLKILGSRLHFEEHFPDGDEEIDDFEWDHFYDDEYPGRYTDTETDTDSEVPEYMYEDTYGHEDWDSEDLSDEDDDEEIY